MASYIGRRELLLHSAARRLHGHSRCVRRSRRCRWPACQAELPLRCTSKRTELIERFVGELKGQFSGGQLSAQRRRLPGIECGEIA